MATFYIFRHGETFATKFKVPYGWRIFSAPILEEGKPTIQRLGKYLKEIKTDFNVASPFKRCKQTVEIVSAESGKDFIFDKRLGEHVIEPIWVFQRRIKSLLKEIEESKVDSVAICTHGAVIASLTRLLTDQNLRVRDLFRYPEPGILTIIKNGKVSQIDFNKSTLRYAQRS